MIITKKRPSVAVMLPLLAMAAVVLANCGKPVPVQELSDARNEIAEATMVKAEKYANEKYTSSKQSLLAAHTLLLDEKFEDAQKKALEARDAGLDAREQSAPLYGADEKKLTEQFLKDAEEAYAEVLAKDDYQAAKKLLMDGSELLTQANAEKKGAGVPTPKRHSTLRVYGESIRKLQAARQAAIRAKNVALAQKDDLLDSLAGVDNMLKRAELYKANETIPELYNNAKSEVAAARKDIEEGKLKDGNAHILRAEELAKAVLNNSLDKYAKQKMEEAKVAVNGADERFKDIVPEKVADAGLRDRVARLKETLAAAREAQKSGEQKYGSRQYENSITESEEAIRLSKIIDEQLVALKQSFTTVTKRGNTTEPKKTEPKTEPVAEGTWKRYKVRRKKPVDCLWRIAAYKFHYGNPWLWRKIYEANKSKIKNPNLIYPGQVLRIPPKTYKPGDKEPAKTTDKPLEVDPKKGGNTQPRENIE